MVSKSISYIMWQCVPYAIFFMQFHTYKTETKYLLGILTTSSQTKINTLVKVTFITKQVLDSSSKQGGESEVMKVKNKMKRKMVPRM